jgi:hypothetical protein
MLTALMWVLTGGIAILGSPGQTGANLSQLSRPTTERIEISVAGALGNDLAACRLTGEVTLWVSRPVAVLDDMHENAGSVEAGLAQFGKQSSLGGCVPDGGVLDLSDRFANFLVVDDEPWRSGTFGRTEAGILAAQLARDAYHLAHPEGASISLTDGFTLNAPGSVPYRFMIVLIRNVDSGSFDAVIYRATLGAKFSARPLEADRRLSALSWSSVQ